VLSEPHSYPEPTSVSITRLVCLTAVILCVLVGAGILLLIRPEYANVAIALMGVVIGGAFGLVTTSRPRRGEPH
jgi:hypothetical protein